MPRDVRRRPSIVPAARAARSDRTPDRVRPRYRCSSGMSRSSLPFELVLERPESRRPEGLDEGRDRSKAFELDGVEVLRAFLSRLDEAGLVEHRQMLRGGLLGDVDRVRDLSDRARPAAQKPQDLDAPGFAERFEGKGCLLLVAFHKCLLV